MKRGILCAWVVTLAVISVLAWSEWRAVAHGQLVHATAHLLVAWLGTLLLMCSMKQARWAAVSAGFCIVFLWTWSEPLRTKPAQLDLSQVETNTVFELRAVWFNAWGKPRSIDQVRRYAVEQQADIVILCQAAGGPALKALTEVYPYAEYNRTQQIGVWSRFPLSDAEWIDLASQSKPPSRPLLAVKVEVSKPSGGVAALPILVSHVRRPHLVGHAEGMAAIHRASAENGPQALFADLNSTPWAANFRGLLASGWHDSRAGQWPRRTWREPSMPLWRWPIDHVLTRGNCVAQRSMIGPDLGSDHLPLLVDLRFLPS